MNHCCKNIKNYLQASDCFVGYVPQIREYYFDLQNGCSLRLDYCPWCGAKLPKELRDEIFDVLEKEYGLELNVDELKTDPRVPPEFLTDEWWKKRGL
jgi:hypothetical protein